MMLAAAHHHGRDKHIGLTVSLGLQIGHDGKFSDVIFGIAHDLLEQVVGNLHLDQIEIDQIRTNRAALERFRVRIIAQHHVQLELCCSGHETSVSWPERDKA
jgi:hypothetical protein